MLRRISRWKLNNHPSCSAVNPANYNNLLGKVSRLVQLRHKRYKINQSFSDFIYDPFHKLKPMSHTIIRVKNLLLDSHGLQEGVYLYFSANPS